MKRMLAAIAFAAVGFSVALAADDPMASRYGNTLVIKGADGKEVIRLYYDQGGALSTKTPDGKTTKATWKMDGEKICVTQTLSPSIFQVPLDVVPSILFVDSVPPWS